MHCPYFEDEFPHTSEYCNHPGNVKACRCCRYSRLRSFSTSKQKIRYPKISFYMPKRMFNTHFSPCIDFPGIRFFILPFESFFVFFIYGSNDLSAFLCFGASPVVSTTPAYVRIGYNVFQPFVSFGKAGQFVPFRAVIAIVLFVIAECGLIERVFLFFVQCLTLGWYYNYPFG